MNFDELLEEWFKESDVDWWDFSDPKFRLIDSGWFKPKRSFNEFVHAKIYAHISGEKANE